MPPKDQSEMKAVSIRDVEGNIIEYPLPETQLVICNEALDKLNQETMWKLNNSIGEISFFAQAAGQALNELIKVLKREISEGYKISKKMRRVYHLSKYGKNQRIRKKNYRKFEKYLFAE